MYWIMSAGIIFVLVVYVWMLWTENTQMREDITKLMQEKVGQLNIRREMGIQDYLHGVFYEYDNKKSVHKNFHWWLEQNIIGAFELGVLKGHGEKEATRTATKTKNKSTKKV